MIYFGARYYDPDIARFITQDSYLGESGTPPSLHRYLYAYSNPTVYIDLYGYRAQLEWETAQIDGREKASAKYLEAYEAKSTLGKIGDRFFGGYYQKHKILEKHNKLHRAAIEEADEGEAVISAPGSNATIDVNMDGLDYEISMMPGYLTARQAKFYEQYANLDAAARSSLASGVMIWDPDNSAAIQITAAATDILSNTKIGMMSQRVNPTTGITIEKRGQSGKTGIRKPAQRPQKTDFEKKRTPAYQRRKAAQALRRSSMNKEGSTKSLEMVERGLISTISKEGYIDFKVDTVTSVKRIPGHKLFPMMLEHYGKNVKGIRGTWMNRDKTKENKNLGKVNELTAKGMKLEKAITKTWTSEQAKLYGFSNVKLINEPKGTPGNYTKVEVLIIPKQ